MSVPKIVYVEFNIKSKLFRFVATPPEPRLGGSEFIYFPIDEEMPVYLLMDFIAKIK